MDMVVDRVIHEFDVALRSVFGSMPAARRSPAGAAAQGELDEDERRLSAALMRVDHVGEVCAQALYQAQALTTSNEMLATKFRAAAIEERDHLGWTAARLEELGARPSVLNPIWYGGAFALGLMAGRMGDRISLGFVAETERQVEQHLLGHLERLPAGDHASRAIVAQMKIDEVQHAEDAIASGGTPLPAVVCGAMRAMARVMTTTAHYI